MARIDGTGTERMGERVMIMAGGTGGHVFPGLAVAAALRAHGHAVSWLGTTRGIEARVVPETGIPLDFMAIEGLRGKGVLAWLTAPLRVLFALHEARGHLRVRRPSVVLGMGGFVSGPGALAARLSGVPLVIHEQNARAGFANRWLAPLARRVLCAFPGALGARGETTGNPVRAEIAALAEPVVRLADRSGPLRVLVLGGSLGARAINRLVPEWLAALAPGERPEVWHQTGRQTHEETLAAYRGHGVEARIAAFIDDMAQAYAWADVVLCRAGAITVAELAAVGLAALLVPYPHAVDDHQTHNARYLEDVGAAWLIQERDLDARGLVAWFRGLDRRQLVERASRARERSMSGAAEVIARVCIDEAQRGRGRHGRR